MKMEKKCMGTLTHSIFKSTIHSKKIKNKNIKKETRETEHHKIWFYYVYVLTKTHVCKMGFYVWCNDWEQTRTNGPYHEKTLSD